MRWKWFVLFEKPPCTAYPHVALRSSSLNSVQFAKECCDLFSDIPLDFSFHIGGRHQKDTTIRTFKDPMHCFSPVCDGATFVQYRSLRVLMSHNNKESGDDALHKNSNDGYPSEHV